MLVFLPKSRPIYKISAKEARWEAFLPKNVCLIFKIEGNLPRLQARLSHFVGHLPTGNNEKRYSTTSMVDPSIPNGRTKSLALLTKLLDKRSIIG